MGLELVDIAKELGRKHQHMLLERSFIWKEEE